MPNIITNIAFSSLLSMNKFFSCLNILKFPL